MRFTLAISKVVGPQPDNQRKSDEIPRQVRLSLNTFLVQTRSYSFLPDLLVTTIVVPWRGNS